MNSPEIQERLQKANEDQDKLLKLADAKIAKALTANQKSKFNKALGEPFDIELLATGGGMMFRGGGPQQRGGGDFARGGQGGAQGGQDAGGRGGRRGGE